MNILAVSTYGIGNVILTTPALASLSRAGHNVDLTIEKDRGTLPIAKGLATGKNSYGKPIIQNVHCRKDKIFGTYDTMIRFTSEKGTKPDIETLDEEIVNRQDGTSNWMENFNDHEVVKSWRFITNYINHDTMPPLCVPYEKMDHEFEFEDKKFICMGIGYYKGDDWSQKKHWGNKKYGKLGTKLSEMGYIPIMLGSKKDEGNAIDIVRYSDYSCYYRCGCYGILESIGILKNCVGYIGNDTALMHCAAGFNLPTIGIFKNSNPKKSSPWCKRGVVLDGRERDIDVEEVVNAWENVCKLNK